MASTYGDGTNGSDGRMMDFVPLSRSVFKTKMREISPELSPTSSQNSPPSDRDESTVAADSYLESQEPTTAVAKESQPDENNPLDSQTLLKKVAQLSEILEARENRLVAVNKENCELHEVNAHMKQRIEQMEETNGDLELVKGEFGQRLHELERKLQNALREKELVKKQLMVTQEEVHNRTGTSSKMQRMVEEKDEVITSLMEEGEKLQKQQLQSNNLIKRLRRQEKEQEELVKTLKEKVEYEKSETARLKGVLDSKIDNESRHTEMIKNLDSAVLKYQTEISKLKSDLEDSLERTRRAESAVDNSYKEIAELHKVSASKDSLIRELKSEADQEAKERLQMALSKKEKEAARDANHLTSQIEDMQLTISRMEKEHYRREESLQQQVSDLITRLEAADQRNGELTHGVASATKPLLRQIENLQSSYSAQSDSWEKLERNLTERLAESQTQLATIAEKERVSSDALMELSARTNSLESQLSSTKQEKSKLTAELEMAKLRMATLEDEKNSAITKLESYKLNLEAGMSDLKRTKTLLENQLEAEKEKAEMHKKKVASIMEQLNAKEQQLTELMSRGRNTPSPSLAVDDSRQHVKQAIKQEQLLERALSNSTLSGSLYDSARHQGTTAIIENLESQVKQREGEISQLQSDIGELERTRESLTNEMLNLSAQNEKHEAKIRQLSKIQHHYKELNARYNALLQMYGEKEEEVSELRLDLADIKQMYKQQIDALLAK